MPLTRKVEFFLARSNHTWNTMVVEVPDTVIGTDIRDGSVADAHRKLTDWATTTLLPRADLRDVIMIAVYRIAPTQSGGTQ